MEPPDLDESSEHAGLSAGSSTRASPPLQRAPKAARSQRGDAPLRADVLASPALGVDESRLPSEVGGTEAMRAARELLSLGW